LSTPKQLKFYKVEYLEQAAAAAEKWEGSWSWGWGAGENITSPLK